jgi:hypothetical protein
MVKESGLQILQSFILGHIYIYKQQVVEVYLELRQCQDRAVIGKYLPCFRYFHFLLNPFLNVKVISESSSTTRIRLTFGDMFSFCICCFVLLYPGHEKYYFLDIYLHLSTHSYFAFEYISCSCLPKKRLLTNLPNDGTNQAITNCTQDLKKMSWGKAVQFAKVETSRLFIQLSYILCSNIDSL